MIHQDGHPHLLMQVLINNSKERPNVPKTKANNNKQIDNDYGYCSYAFNVPVLSLVLLNPFNS